MASSFGAVNILVLRNDGDGRVPRWSKPRYFAVQPIPNGTDHTTQLLGHGRERVTHKLWLTEAEYAALDALVQTQATLTLAGVSQGTCVLLSLENEVSDYLGDVLVDALFEKVV